MTEHVTSILRVRPSAERKCDSVEEKIKLSVSPDGKTVTLPHYPAPPTSSDVTFHRVYTTTEDNCTVYNDGVRKTVESTLLGYNGTVISLEVAGSHSEGSTLQDTVARAAKQIFVCLKKSKRSRSAANLVVNCSFVAVADEKAYDLLTSASDHEIGTLQQEAPFRSLPFNDECLQASIHEAKSQPQVLALLQRGHREEEKLVEWLPSHHHLDTAHARELSYHHTILSLTVEYTHFGTMNAPVSGTLSFVRLSSPHLLVHQGQYIPETQLEKPDPSLHTLVKVVSALTAESPVEVGEGSQCPPSQLDVRELYSKSLLTQILKEAIGGNCKTVFLCQIPESLPVSSLPEARAALQLVSRARHIQNRPNKRDLAERALMSAYMKQLRLQYDRAGGGEKGEETNIASSDANGEEERQQAMELAATALAEAVEIGEDHGDSEDEDDEKFSSRSDEKLWISLNIPGKHRQKGHGSEGGATGASGVTIDALVGVLQDPDRGVPRALETRLQDVKIRRDVGALFSGAAIVKWMLGHVEGVETEDDAVILGQLLVDEGAIFHSEGSMVFANADSLFYYAREARLGKRLLSQEEIQALLSHARDPESTHVTSVPVKRSQEVIEEDEPQEDELCGGQGEYGGPEGDRGQGEYGGLEGDGGPEGDGGQGEYKGPEDDENQGVRGAGDGKSLKIEGEMDVIPYDPLSSDQVEQLIPLHGSDHALHPAVDQNDASGGGEPTDSRTSMESWMLDREETNFEEIDGQEGIGAEGRERVAEEEEEADRNPNTTLQHSIPSIQTLENSVDYPHPLHMAVAVGKHPGVIRNLVMMFGVDRTDDQGRTPLMFAALGNKRSSCSTLIECGAVVNAQDASGLTALHVACYHGSKEATRVLLSKKATVTTADKMGHTALHWATIPTSTACLQLLLSHMWPELLKQVDSSGLTALHWAIFYNRPHHLKLLLKKYSDVLEVDSSGRTLLTYSIERDLPNKDCITVLTESCPYLLTQQDTSGRLPLHVASMSSSPLPISLLITNRPPKSAPLEVNCVDPHMRTPLHYAAVANNLENAKVLLSVLADPQAVDSEGRTPLDYARHLEDGADMVELLQVAGGDAPQTVLDYTSPQLAHSLPAKLDMSTSATSSEFCTLL